MDFTVPAQAQTSCQHIPPCPPATAPDHDAAHIAASHHEQGWIRLDNGVIVFDDTGELSPTGVPTAPHRNNVRLAGVA